MPDRSVSLGQIQDQGRPHRAKILFQKKPAKVFLKKTRTQHAYLPTVQRSNLRFQPPLTWLAEIRHCAVLGPDISVISPDGALLSDVSLAWEDDILNYPIFRSPVWKKPFFVKGEAALLAVTGGNNYFHWLFESLPRLELLHQGRRIRKLQRYVVNGLRPGFQTESLDMLGLDRRSLISLEDVPYMVLEKALIPSYPCHYGTPAKPQIEFLRAKLKKPLHGRLSKNRGRERWFVRRRQGGRQLLHEDAIEQALQPFGFRAVEPEKLPLHQQIALFDQAEVVIAPHGAGLANIIFCRPGTKILEIFSGDYVNLCYQHLAGNCGLNHFAVHPWSKKDGLLALNSADRGLNRKDIPILPEDILPVLAQAKVNRK